ncbi:TRAP transporter substrate-binding protein [bacterium LRH843]|nr:TRAP transporter substrate-binding protein [bacterium LRH843]
MFRIGIISAVLSCLVFLGGCGGTNSVETNNSTDTKIIKIANWYADDHAVNIALNEKFKPMVEENSGGTLKVEIYSNSKLGGEEAMYDSVRNGSLEMAEIGVIMEGEVPMISILTLPFLFKDFEHAKKVLNGEVGNEIGEQLEEITKVKFLGYGVNGLRSFSSNRPIEKMGDFKGYKVRTPNIPQLIETGHALGATVTPMAISEIFTALESKVVDGQDNPISTLRSNGWYEVQSHVLESQHLFLPNTIMANGDFWNSLTTEQQEVVQEAINASVAYEWEVTEEFEVRDKEYLKEKGLTFITPDEGFKKEMKDATEEIYNSFYEKNAWGKEIIEKIRSLE